MPTKLTPPADPTPRLVNPRGRCSWCARPFRAGERYRLFAEPDGPVRLCDQCFTDAVRDGLIEPEAPR